MPLNNFYLNFLVDTLNYKMLKIFTIICLSAVLGVACFAVGPVVSAGGKELLKWVGFIAADGAVDIFVNKILDHTTTTTTERVSVRKWDLDI